MPTKLTRRGFLRNLILNPSPLVEKDFRPTTPRIESDFKTLSPRVERGQGVRLPDVRIANWQLSIGGQIEGRERIFRWNNLQDFTTAEIPYTLECIGNPAGGDLIYTANFQGIRLHDLLQDIQLKPTATYACFLAADGYRTFIALDPLNHPDTILAVAIDGQPLTPEQGFPARLLIPGVYGYKMPKWILRMEFIHQPGGGFWESRGWSQSGIVQTHTIIFPNQPPVNVDQPIHLSGIALSGTRGISMVDIRIDGGEWIPAHLVSGNSSHTAWYLDWTPAAPGDYLIEARATDGDGNTQSETASASPRPDGCAAIHKIVVRVEP